MKVDYDLKEIFKAKFKDAEWRPRVRWWNIDESYEGEFLKFAEEVNKKEKSI